MDRAALKSILLILLCAIAGSCAWPHSPMLAMPDPLSPQNELFSQGKYDLLIEQLSQQAIEKLPRSERSHAYYLLAQSYDKSGRMDQALGVYQFAEGLFPKDLQILSGLAGVLHRIGLDERAQPYYQRVIDIHPNNAAANRGLAEITRDQGLLPESCQHYENALAELPQDATLWRDYAEVLAARRDFPKATEAIRHSLGLQRDVDSQLDLAIFERRQGLKKEAYKDLSEAIRLSPKRSDPVERGALWRLEDGELDVASKLASDILEKNPDDALAHWIRACSALREGRRDSAKKDLAFIVTQDRQPFAVKVAAAMLKELE